MSISPKKLRQNLRRTRIALGALMLGVIATNLASASGVPPTAADDTLLVAKGGTATALSNGSDSVLDNDIDIENDPLTVELVKDAKHGELTLNEDGTFTYLHDGKNSKDDDFKYRVFDGSEYSSDAKVKIEISDTENTSPFAVGSPPDQGAVEGIFFQLALADYFGDIDEGDTLQFSAAGLPASGGLSIDLVSGILSGTPTAVDARDSAYDLAVIATDSGGLTASLSFQLFIYSDGRANLTVATGLSVNPVTVGESAQWNIVVHNLGPSDLDEGELVAQWSTSGPALSLGAPPDCTIFANNSKDPSARCSLNSLGAGASKTIAVQGTQDSDGDNSLIAVAVSQDANVGSNLSLIGAQVVSRFSEGPTQFLSTTGHDIASGDLNGDGYQDLVVASTQTVVYFNSGNRTVISPGTSLGADSGGLAVVVLDWNGDNNPDVAVAGMSGKAGRIYINEGNGTFSQSIDLTYSDSGTITAAGVADFDWDGFTDLALTGTGGSHLLRNTGQSGFSVTTLSAGPGIDVSIADTNSDSFADILVVESGDRSVRVLRNSGDGRNFASQRLQRGSVAGVSGADLNGDGRTDLLLAIDGGNLTAPESKILYQNPDGSFPAGAKIGASPLGKMLAGDVDGDSLPDIVALNEAGVHQVYLGLAGGGFALSEEQIVSSGMRRGVVLDFNNDQSLDLIMAGRDSSVVEIHANNGIGRLGRGDRVAPVVLLTGEATVAIPAGGFYEDPGATATDDIDGDLTTSVVTSGSFTTSVVGTYTLNYSVSNRAGNVGSATRVVNVGVNQGVGGGGGGVMTPWTLVLQLLLLVATVGRRTLSARSHLIYEISMAER
ncbi:MAG: FG-GAP-like repeat-containing protein [Proteobacteria bacterium]|nr:FG-GAP-like repeat-containing protein [Pseudomonadota bacterium]